MEQVIIEKKESLFTNTNFILLFLGKWVSQIGDSIYNFAISLYILDLTGSGLSMGTYLSIGVLTRVVMGPIGGVIADRVNKVRLIYMTDFIRGTVILLGGYMVYSEASVPIVLLTLYGISIVINSCGSIFNPTSMALIPMIVKKEQLTKANSASMALEQGANILGLLLGSVLYVTLGAVGIFVLNGGSYVVSGISEMFIKVKEAERVKKIGKSMKEAIIDFLKELKDGFAYIKKEKLIMTLISFAVLLNLVFAPLTSVFITYTFKELLQAPPLHLALIQIAFALGFIVGSVIIAAIPYEKAFAKTIKIALAIESSFALILPIAIHYRLVDALDALTFLGIVSVAFTGIGLFNAGCNIPIQVVIQKTVPEQLLGRVFSLLATLCTIAMPIGLLIGGMVVDYKISIVTALLVEVILFGLITVGVVVSKNIKDL